MALRCLPRLSKPPLLSMSCLYTDIPAFDNNTTMATFILQSAYTEGSAEDIDNSNFILNILHNRVNFRIASVAKNFELSPTALQIHCAIFSAIENHDPLHNDLSKEIESFRQRFDEPMMAIANEVHNDQEVLKSLRSYIYPFQFNLEALVNESGDIIPYLDGSRKDRKVLVPGVHEAIAELYFAPLLKYVDHYSSRQIRVLSCNEKAVPSLVGVDDQKYFFQPISDHNHSSLKGLRSYDFILKDRELSANHKICHLRGLVVDEDADIPFYGQSRSSRNQNKRLVGLLLDHIDVGATLQSYIASFSHTKQEKDRWYKDICDVVGRLHDRHITWGNVSPENVLIDREGQIHLTGFVGQPKGNWVDKDWKHSTKGDERGLLELKAWLFGEKGGTH